MVADLTNSVLKYYSRRSPLSRRSRIYSCIAAQLASQQPCATEPCIHRPPSLVQPFLNLLDFLVSQPAFHRLPSQLLNMAGRPIMPLSRGLKICESHTRARGHLQALVRRTTVLLTLWICGPYAIDTIGSSDAIEVSAVCSSTAAVHACCHAQDLMYLQAPCPSSISAALFFPDTPRRRPNWTSSEHLQERDHAGNTPGPRAIARQCFCSARQ